MDPVILDQLQAQEEKLKELYESVKPTVWAVKITGLLKGVADEINYTAFAVHKNAVENKVYLMSCAHGGWHTWNQIEVHARPVNGIAGVEYKGKVFDIRPKSDMSLIEVPLDGVVGVVVGKFGSGDLDVGEMIMAIGNYGCCKGTCMIGRLIYPCIANPKSRYSDKRTCENHVSNYALDTKQPCRIAGHLFNVGYFKGMFKDTLKSDLNWVKNLQANLPIVHCAGLVGGGGCSGSPMFNMKGEIIGMFISGVDDYKVGVHVSYLKVFLEDNLKNPNEDLGNIAKKRHKKKK